MQINIEQYVSKKEKTDYIQLYPIRCLVAGLSSLAGICDDHGAPWQQQGMTVIACPSSG